MKLRADDLDHIVDELSDNEGDEELGRIARIAQEREDDRFVRTPSSPHCHTVAPLLNDIFRLLVLLNAVKEYLMF